jgi:hypothetical protein
MKLTDLTQGVSLDGESKALLSLDRTSFVAPPRPLPFTRARRASL